MVVRRRDLRLRVVRSTPGMGFGGAPGDRTHNCGDLARNEAAREADERYGLKP